ncbi:mesoderm induction early response protein [Rhynchospora pubera]|uniref:Mesoderm induction early response protein n=1 Tax=Rhynchospora pubera TaxID=906938 RepID=A0AAV8EE36_9POAL|nr:mesoderm induction early response protein [Rhynchospora pubera]
MAFSSWPSDLFSTGIKDVHCVDTQEDFDSELPIESTRESTRRTSAPFTISLSLGSRSIFILSEIPSLLSTISIEPLSLSLSLSSPVLEKKKEIQNFYHIRKMSDDGKGAEGSTSKETDWDMLSSISSSAYTEKEPTTESLFLPDHFVFPPNEHENLPIEPELPEPELEPEPVIEEAEEQLQEGIDYQSSPEVIKYFEEGQRIAVHDSDEEETGSALIEDDGIKNEDGDGEKALPCEAWWKRRAICLYKNVKEANTIWSVLVAAAVMGIVILGQRWHKEKWQVNSRWRFNINNEAMSKILGSKH